MRWILLALGAVIAAALLATGTILALDAIGALSGTRIGDTRTPVPGTREAELQSGRHTVFYEVEEASVESHGPEGGVSIDVPPLEIAIRRDGDGPALELDDYSGDLDVTSGGRAATAVRTVRVPDEGLYRISVAGPVDAASPAIVLGRPLLGRIMRMLVTIAAIVAGLCLWALVLASGIALRTRAPRAST